MLISFYALRCLIYLKQIRAIKPLIPDNVTSKTMFSFELILILLGY